MNHFRPIYKAKKGIIDRNINKLENENAWYKVLEINQQCLNFYVNFRFQLLGILGKHFIQ